jgi:hypothetical protein
MFVTRKPVNGACNVVVATTEPENQRYEGVERQNKVVTQNEGIEQKRTTSPEPRQVVCQR